MLSGVAISKSLKGFTPQLYAADLKCSSYTSELLLASAQYTVANVKAVGQEASPSKRVLPSTSKADRERFTEWRNANAGCSCPLKLAVRDLGPSVH